MSLPSPLHPGFFEVLATRRAYTTLLYLLLSLATGIFAFTYAVTGLSLGLGLLAMPLGHLFHFNGSFNLDLCGGAWIIAHPDLAMLLSGLAGLFRFPSPSIWPSIWPASRSGWPAIC